MRYLIWNNKGGVGKTFLTYCLATEYASKHPDKKVVVVDVCPQSNVSEMLLGGNGKGEDNLAKCYDNDRTIASYIKSRYDRSRFGKIGDEINYFIKVADYNSNISENLYLLPGDTDLDICSSIIDYLASAPERNAWGKSRAFLLDLIGVFEGVHSTSSVFFIDSNPSFANYTQLGIVSSDRLIVPCTADSASIRGIFNILRLIYGIKAGANVPKDDVFDSFSIKIKDTGITPPRIHAFVLNKARTAKREASVAYKSHVEQIEKNVIELVESYPDVFTNIQNDRVFHLKDCNTIAPVLNYNGLLPSSLKNGRYSVYEDEAQVNMSQVTPFLENLERIVADVD